MSETIRDRLMAALSVEYGAGWQSIYTDETKARLGAEAARLNIQPIMAAIERAGLILMERPDP